MKINEFFVDQPAKSCLRRLELRKEKVLGDVQISRLFFYTANVIPAAGCAVVAAAAAAVPRCQVRPILLPVEWCT